MEENPSGPSGVKRKFKVENFCDLSDSEFLQISSDEELDVMDYVKLCYSDYSSENSSDESSVDENDTIPQHNQIISSWSDNFNSMKSLSFSKIQALLIPVPGSGQPIDFFFLLADDTFFDMIVKETNKFAEGVFLAGVKESSRITRWRDVSIEEMKTFFGLLFHMGTIKINRTGDYWSKDQLFNFCCFADHMSRDRFAVIMRCLHFNNGASNDKLDKIRPVVDFFNNKMSQIYQPGQNLSVDESMVLWRGTIKQKHKHGMKLHVLKEPDGLILKTVLHTNFKNNQIGKDHTSKIVLDLLEGKFNFGHSLYMNNYYTSVPLVEQLLKKGTNCTGTLRKTRKDNPKEVTCKKIGKDETFAKCKNGIMVGAWKNKRNVLYISSEFENILTKCTNKRGDETNIPLPIIKYNENICDIDGSDQLLLYYSCERKILRWYKKIAIHIFQMMLLNSFYLYNKYSGQKKALYNFRLEVIKNLLNIQEQRRSTHKSKKQSHVLTKITKKNEKGETNRKRCQQCSKMKKRKMTLYECVHCDGIPGLCVGECFDNYHN